MKNIKIGGTVYKIQNEKDSFVEAGKAIDGGINYSQSLIRVARDNKSKQYADTTLIHEIVHGIIEEYNVEIPEEEKFTEGFSKGLYQVLKDNPKLVEYIRL